MFSSNFRERSRCNFAAQPSDEYSFLTFDQTVDRGRAKLACQDAIESRWRPAALNMAEFSSAQFELQSIAMLEKIGVQFVGVEVGAFRHNEEA